MSDWWAINTDSYENFANGLDMNMPGGTKFPATMVEFASPSHSWWEALPDWIESGSVTKERIDDAALRIIASMYKVGLIPDTYDESKAYPNGVGLQKNTITAYTLITNRKAARESFILLQNKDNVLPLANNKKNTATYSKFAVVGNSAKKTSCEKINNNVCYDSENKRYYEGHLYIGWGSGATDINYDYISEPLEAITNKVVNDLGGSITSSTNLINKTNNYYEEDLDSVPSTINEADVIIVFIMANSGEDGSTVEQTLGDRPDFNVWHNGNGLVEKVLSSKTDSQ
jgi:beta-glucosidase-like glycosyl hydrolase